MTQWLASLQSALELIKKNIPMALLILAIFWVIFLINMLLGKRLNYLGIYPRHVAGLIGIFFSPFLHANFNHLFFNSVPLFVLTVFMLLYGLKNFIIFSLVIIFFSGILIWLFARKAIHIGASALIMGYWGFLIVDAYYHPSILSIPVIIVCVYYFGGLILSLFPSSEKVSWEGHLFGLIAGILTSYLSAYLSSMTTSL